MGAIVDGTVLGSDASNGLMRVRVGHGELKLQVANLGLPAASLGLGAKLRVHLLARDLIVATRPPQHVSVRNILSGVISAVTGDDAGFGLGRHRHRRYRHHGAASTKAATRELALEPGLSAWALVKAVSLRSHSFAAPAAISTAPRDA